MNDIAVLNQQGSLQLFFNSGAGSFQQISLNNLSTSQALGLDVGDIDGDGKNDIVVAFATANGSVSVLRNLGSRTFANPVNYDVCSGLNSVAIGDIDRDGDNDLAATGQCSQAGVLPNNGLGGFGPGRVYGTGNNPKSIALADFNRDGSLDIAFLNVAVHGTITILKNQRDGTFAPFQNLFAAISLMISPSVISMAMAARILLYRTIILEKSSSFLTISPGPSRPDTMRWRAPDIPPASRREILTATAVWTLPTRTLKPAK